MEVPGDVPGLAYPRDRAARFTDDFVSEGKVFKYRCEGESWCAGGCEGEGSHFAGTRGKGIIQDY